MFYNKMRKNEETNYENASKALNNSIDSLNVTISKFHKIQEDSVALIDKLCEILNTIANTPIEIQSDINKTLIITDAFKFSRTLNALPDAIQDTGDLLLKNLGNVWTNSGLGTNSKLIITGAFVISFGAVAIIDNKRIADELHEATKTIYRKTADADRFTISIEARIVEIDVVLKGLEKSCEQLKTFRNVSYSDIDTTQKRFLGSSVNNMLTLSGLITNKIV